VVVVVVAVAVAVVILIVIVLVVRLYWERRNRAKLLVFNVLG